MRSRPSRSVARAVATTRLSSTAPPSTRVRLTAAAAVGTPAPRAAGLAPPSLSRRFAWPAALVVGLLAVACLAGPLAWIWGGALLEAAPQHPPVVKQFFMDEQTGEVLVRPADEPPPLANARGQRTVVGAVYYSWDGGKTRHLAYLQRYSDDAQDAYRAIRTQPAAARDPAVQARLAEGTYIRAPERGSPWVLLDSKAASEVSARALRDCPASAQARICQPQ